MAPSFSTSLIKKDRATALSFSLSKRLSLRVADVAMTVLFEIEVLRLSDNPPEPRFRGLNCPHGGPLLLHEDLQLQLFPDFLQGPDHQGRQHRENQENQRQHFEHILLKPILINP